MTETVEVCVHELEDTFLFLLLPEYQPVLSMGQLSDADFDFSWRKINGVKTMRVFNDTGTYVECSFKIIARDSIILPRMEMRHYQQNGLLWTTCPQPYP